MSSSIFTASAPIRFGAVVTLLTLAAPAQTWLLAHPEFHPRPRVNHSMVFDAARNVTILFGGSAPQGFYNENWEWNGTDWAFRPLAVVPAPRQSAGMAYDSARQRVVLFGGSDYSHILGDSWEWDGTTWLAITTAVAPLCWESKTFLATVSGADSITLLPHQGYLVRTQPNTTLQGRKFGEFALEQGGKKVFFLTPQTPFAKSQFDNITAAVEKGGGKTGTLIYDDKKPAYRTEIDEALRFDPDTIVLGGYTTDTSVMVKDLFRAGFKGKKRGNKKPTPRETTVLIHKHLQTRTRANT